MFSSGLTGISTASDAAVTLLDVGGARPDQVNIINEGTIAGFISLDSGTTWMRMPAGPSARTFDIGRWDLSPLIKAKRIAGGSNMTGLFADAY